MGAIWLNRRDLFTALGAIGASRLRKCSNLGRPEQMRIHPRWINRPLSHEYFGIHVNYLAYPEGSGSSFSFFNPGALRSWDQFVTWRLLEPAPGQFDWTNLDRIVEAQRAAGVRRSIYTFGQPPGWAAGQSGPPGSQYNPSPPKDLVAWERYVKSFLDRNEKVWSSQFNSFEVWNEIDNRSFYCGDLEHMIKMSHIVHDCVKYRNRNYVVLSPSFTTTGIDLFSKYLSLGGKKYYDVLSIHPYPDPQEPEEILRIVEKFRRVQQGGKPVSITECGYFYGYFLSGRKVLDEALPGSMAASYVARMLLSGIISGAENFFFYSVDAPVMKIKLDDRAGVPSLAGRVYSFMSSALRGASLTGGIFDGEKYSLEFELRGGRKGVVTWTVDDASARAYTGGGALSTRVDGIVLGDPKLQRVTSMPMLVTY